MAQEGWDNDPTDYGELVIKVHKDLVQKASIYLLRSVVLKSPVDTGRFRANWQINESVSSNTVISNFNEGKAGSTKSSVTSNSLRSGTKKVKSSDNNFPVFYLTNNLPYATRIENGWSDQAPQGVVAISLLDTKLWLDRQ